MLRLGLWIIVMTSTGCILPTPLRAAETPDNFTPSLRAVPPFGPIVRSDAPFDLQVFAEDANVDDQLRARMLNEISTFVGDGPKHDDMTILLLRLGEASASLSPARVEAAAGVRV